MTPWFRMPSGADATRQVASERLRRALGGAQCAVSVLEQSCQLSVRERALLRAVIEQLCRAESELKRL